MKIINEKLVAHTIMINHVLNILVFITRKVRNGELLEGENAGAAQKIAELTNVCAQQTVCNRQDALDLAIAIHEAGHVQEGMGKIFSNLTGWKFPAKDCRQIEPLPISREPDLAMA